jgi:transporter family-2 protein
MNGALSKSLENPSLASTISFLPVIAFLLVLFYCLPNRFCQHSRQEV